MIKIKTFGFKNEIISMNNLNEIRIEIPSEGMDGAEEMINYIKDMRYLLNYALPKILHQRPSKKYLHVIEYMMYKNETKILIKAIQIILDETIRNVEKVNPDLGLYLELMEE